MVEFAGTGWRDDMYRPDTAWLEIHESDTDGVYEVTFNFEPALKGVMLLSASKEAMMQHRKIMDTVDWQVRDDYTSEDEDLSVREAFRQGLMLGLKRKRGETDEERLAYCKKPRVLRGGTGGGEGADLKYKVLCRGTCLVPDWECDDVELEGDESSGYLDFKEGFCEFRITLLGQRPYKGVPAFEHSHSYHGV